MQNLPEKIYLQAVEDGEEFDELATTWCSDKINEEDIEYRRADSDYALLSDVPTNEQCDELMAALLNQIKLGYAVGGNVEITSELLNAHIKEWFGRHFR